MTPLEAASRLLAQTGHSPAERVTALPGGRNNRVWRVDCGSEAFLLKHYFQSAADPRDRLGQEWAFLVFLQSIGSRKAPAPLAQDAATRFALLEFLPGQPPPHPTAAHVRDAARFFAAMNAHRAAAHDLPPVSEACFSLEAHLATTAQRVERLAQIPPASEPHHAAIAFVKNLLQPLWLTVCERLANLPAAMRTASLSAADRCVSPSDFGFHNALAQPDGSLRYIDFEYAGWDDPAKTLIDFTNQPDRLLPADLASLFLEETVPLFPDPAALRERLCLLTPLYQVKWACICLNAFLPHRAADPTRPLAAQLARAKTMAARASQGATSESPRLPFVL
jgi:hypothetical protein